MFLKVQAVELYAVIESKMLAVKQDEDNLLFTSAIFALGSRTDEVSSSTEKLITCATVSSS